MASENDFLKQLEVTRETIRVKSGEYTLRSGRTKNIIVAYTPEFEDILGDHPRLHTGLKFATTSYYHNNFALNHNDAKCTYICKAYQRIMFEMVFNTNITAEFIEKTNIDYTFRLPDNITIGHIVSKYLDGNTKITLPTDFLGKLHISSQNRHALHKGIFKLAISFANKNGINKQYYDKIRYDNPIMIHDISSLTIEFVKPEEFLDMFTTTDVIQED